MFNGIAALHTVKQYGKMQCQVCITEIIDITAVLFEYIMKDIMDQINEYCINLQCVRSEDSIYTITHVNAVKGKTLEYLINLLGIKKEEVMVFGDNFNDMTMFEIAGISVAMENSQNEVKEKADYQAGSNNHNGVSAFLKKIYRI